MGSGSKLSEVNHGSTAIQPPPQKHLNTTFTSNQAGMLFTRHEATPAFRAKMAEMRKPLCPLVSITTGAVHPFFPKTLLHYWLLTASELDTLAAFYHQSYPSPWTNEYPKVMGWREGMGIEEKRRRWGNFMGLRGCETPTKEWSVRDWEETMMMQIRKGREEEEMMRRKTQGFY